MEIRLLGELEASDGATALAVRGAKQWALLALLALARGAPVSVDRLIAALWGDDLPVHPLEALRTQVAQLRRVLGAAALTTTGGGYALVEADVDVVRFERLVAEGRARLAEGDAAAASARLRRALALCRGEPLAGLGALEFAEGERARLNELVLLAVEARLEADLAAGCHAEVAGELEVLCREHPLRERLWALRMTALYRAGRQADALRCYTEARHRLAEELGIGPGPELQRLEAMVLAHDPTLDPAPRPPGPPPQPPTGVPPRLRRSRLRAPLTSFVGRADEVAELGDRVRRTRLVTLVGPGGVGKTRLAVEAAHRWAAASSAPVALVELVELADVSDPAGVGAAVARAVGVADVGGGAGSARSVSLLDAVVAQLWGTPTLLVVDNCEHLVSEVAGVVDTLLGALGDLRIVATSRERLGVPGETLLHLGGLAPGAAVALFADRAAAVEDRFLLDETSRAAVEEICRRLDGLPLAIELAAARLRTLSLAQLAARLDDRFRLLTGGPRTVGARQQTLRAVVDWSYDLLSADERRVFARLSVFSGGFTLEAAEAVCADDAVPADAVLDLLDRLVDRSLVEAGARGGPEDEPRFGQLQTLARYGRTRLAEAGESEAVRDRHAACFLGLAVAARRRGADAAVARRRLETELDNLRQALDHLISRGDAEGALALAVGTGWLLFTRAGFQEGARWMADALAVPGRARPALRGLAQAWHGYFASFFEGPDAQLAECRAAAEALSADDDPALAADTLLLYASTLNRARQRRRALEVLAQARPLLAGPDGEPGGGPDGEPVDDWRLGLHALIEALTLENSGRLDEAGDAARRSVERFRAAGDRWWIVEPLGILASNAEDRGELERAARAYEDVVERSRDVGGAYFEPRWVARLAAVRARQGEHAEADRLYADTVALGHNPLLTASALVAQALVARRRGDLPRARRLLDDGLARYELLGVVAGCASALAGLAWWALDAGDVNAASAYAERAGAAARRSHDSHTELVVDSARAAVDVVRNPSAAHRAALDALARRRRGFSGGAYAATLDELDVAALSGRFPPVG